MKKNSVSRRDFLAASGVSVAAGLTGAKAEKPARESGEEAEPCLLHARRDAG